MTLRSSAVSYVNHVNKLTMKKKNFNYAFKSITSYMHLQKCRTSFFVCWSESTSWFIS